MLIDFEDKSPAGENMVRLTRIGAVVSEVGGEVVQAEGNLQNF